MLNLDGLDYRDKAVVVTGGSSGMGEQVARILGELGASVHIVDIRDPKVAHASFHQVDLAEFAAVRRGADGLAAMAPIDPSFITGGRK